MATKLHILLLACVCCPLSISLARSVDPVYEQNLEQRRSDGTEGEIGKRNKRFMHFDPLVKAVKAPCGISGAGVAVLATSVLQSGLLFQRKVSYHYNTYRSPQSTASTTAATDTDGAKKKRQKTLSTSQWYAHVYPHIDTEPGRNRATDEYCSLHVTDPTVEKYLPVPLSAEPPYRVFVPHRGRIHLSHGQALNMVCPGARNRLSLDWTEKIHQPRCEKSNILKLNGIDRPLFNFRCSTIVKGQVNAGLGTCAGGRGTLYGIGHKLPPGQWIGLIDVCHDSSSGNTFYAKHQLVGSEIEYASKSSYRPEFSEEGLQIDAASAYPIASQKRAFSTALNSTTVADSYIGPNSFLVKGHLAPHADFLLAISQYTTYFYLNVAPKWQIVNNANWKSLEMAVRKNGTVDIFTGTHGLLTYPDVNDNPSPIYLAENGILPVPKYFWKIVYNSGSNFGIAFVVINDPFLKDGPKAEDLLCPDICTPAGWANPNWANPRKGYLYCCEVSSFKEAVGVSAPNLVVAGVLRATAA